MKIAILTLQIIEVETHSKVNQNTGTEFFPSGITLSKRTQITNVFASDAKCIEYFDGLVDKYRGAIL